MAAEISQITNSTDIKWVSGALFNGFVALTMVLPTGRTKVALKDTRPVLFPPQQVRIQIREGKYETDTRVWRTDSLVPTGVQYFARFYDSDDVLIASGAGNFTVTTDPYTLVPPTLPDA